MSEVKSDITEGFKCNSCNKNYSTKYNLNRHKTNVHNENKTNHASKDYEELNENLRISFDKIIRILIKVCEKQNIEIDEILNDEDNSDLLIFSN